VGYNNIQAEYVMNDVKLEYVSEEKDLGVIGPYPGIAPGGYSIHYTNTNPNPYPGANPG